MVKINKSLTFIIILLTLTSTFCWSQINYKAATVAFYNLENLFDTYISAGYIDGNLSFLEPNYHLSIDVQDIPKYDTVSFSPPYTYKTIEGKKIIRPLILQEEFSPVGSKRWNTDRYNQKLKNLSFVISQLGKEETNSAPVILGVCEIENKQNLVDLISQQELQPYDYGIVHFNSFDARGVDVGLIYQKNRFKVTFAKPYPIEIYDDDGQLDYTRDILRVTGILDGEEISFIVNHWPSRRGGEEKSLPRRIKAAEVMKGIFDEIREDNPDAKIIAMGDFNDDPVSPSITQTLKAVPDKKLAKKEDIVGLMYPLFKKGQGTLAYRDSWNLFDQFFVTGTLIDNSKKFKTYDIFKTKIFSPSYLVTPEGQYKGYPFRMFGGDTYYPNGYSDHFPVYTVLLKEAK